MSRPFAQFPNAHLTAFQATPTLNLKMRRVLAIGGGGFLMEPERSSIDRYILSLTSKRRPKVCYVGTPSGDMPDGIEKFYRAYSPEMCEPSHLAFFRKPSPSSIPLSQYEDHLASQDAIFVSGGSTKSCLGVWREWGADAALRRAYEAGVLLCGMSAGALCWFDAGWTDSVWGAGFQPLHGLGLLTGGCAVHYGAPDDRKSALHTAISGGAMPTTLAIDDYAAVLFEDGVISKVVRWGQGGGAYAVSEAGGSVTEVALESVSLDQIET